MLTFSLTRRAELMKITVNLKLLHHNALLFSEDDYLIIL